MIKKVMLSVLIVLLVGCTPQQTIYEQKNQESIKIYRTLIQSTVVIYADCILDTTDEIIPLGTGSFIDNTHIITAYHVVSIADTNKIFIKQHEWSKRKVSICMKDEEHDLAVLKIESPEKLNKLIALNIRTDPEIGEQLFMVGTPFGYDFTFSTGILIRKETSVDFAPVFSPPDFCTIYLSTIISAPGFSGSPVVDIEGDLIGVLKGRRGSLTAIIPIHFAESMIRAL